MFRTKKGSFMYFVYFLIVIVSSFSGITHIFLQSVSAQRSTDEKNKDIMNLWDNIKKEGEKLKIRLPSYEHSLRDPENFKNGEFQYRFKGLFVNDHDGIPVKNMKISNQDHENPLSIFKKQIMNQQSKKPLQALKSNWKFMTKKTVEKQKKWLKDPKKKKKIINLLKKRKNHRFLFALKENQKCYLFFYYRFNKKNQVGLKTYIRKDKKWFESTTKPPSKAINNIWTYLLQLDSWKDWQKIFEDSSRDGEK